MIFDLGTRTWHTPDQLGKEIWSQVVQHQSGRWVRLDASPAALAAATECLSGAAVLGYRSDLLGACVPHEFVAECVRRDPKRLVGFGGVDPMAPDPIGQVERAMSLGLCGITVSPASQGFHPAHSTAMRVYDRCERAGLPVICSRCGPLTSAAILEFDRPAAWDEIARSFPKLKIVLSELGWPWTEECVAMLGKHRNVYADLAGLASRPWELLQSLLCAGGHGVLEKVLFASGFPFELPEKAIEAIYSLHTFSHGTQLPTVARSSLRAIVERDTLAVLGVDAPGFTGASPSQESGAPIHGAGRTRS